MFLVSLVIFILFSRPCFAQDTPTPVINPASGIYLSEFMPKGSEWVEIFNNNDFDVTLDGWWIDDLMPGGSSPKQIPHAIIPSRSFYIVDLGSGFLNDGVDEVNLLDNSNQLVESVSYSSVSDTLSWSKQSNGSWCQTDPSQSSVNNICLQDTLTPTPTNIFTPTPQSSPTPSSLFNLDSAPYSVQPGEIFSLQFSITNPKPNYEYRIKAVYGLGTESDKICLVKTVATNGDILHNTSSWDLFPVFNSGENNPLTGSINAVLDSCSNGSSLPGSVAVKVKTEERELSHNLQVITINTSPSSSPTSTPRPTSTPKPTSSPKISVTPTPSSTTPTPTQTDTPSPIPSLEPIPDVLGVTSPPVEKQPVNMAKLIPVILMIVGGLFLLTPVLITKFSKK